MNVSELPLLCDTRHPSVQTAKYLDEEQVPYWFVIVGSRYCQVPRPMPRRRAIRMALELLGRHGMARA